MIVHQMVGDFRPEAIVHFGWSNGRLVPPPSKVFATIVATPSTVLPVEGSVRNTNALLAKP